jgi:hypothetical protein
MLSEDYYLICIVLLFSCAEKPEDCGHVASNWIKTVSECIGLYLSKKLRKNYEPRKKTRSATERKLA